MWRQIVPALRMTVVITVLTGLLYPLTVTGLAQALFPRQANGSLIEQDGKTIGSALIGQNFAGAGYFHPRPSAAGANGYDAAASGGSNLGPTNKKLIDRVKQSIQDFRVANPGYTGPIPADLVTTSASGIDPHISPASAEAQVARIAAARGMSPESIQTLVAAHTEGRDLGFLGEPRVNVLLLNLALDNKLPSQK
ncbi:MAG: potassium-transporting ATPase subunit KdpC [Acidobacteriota bacterium]